VWVRGSLMRLRYDQFMRLGWKVLIPSGLAWIALWGIGRILYVEGWLPDVKSFTVPAAIVLALATFVVLLWPTKPAEEKPTKVRIKEIDAMADGFPVPPKPGEKLPPSPRSTRTVESKPPAKGPGDRA
jgi:NADH-quinone oxidoreductase subunit H